MSVLSRQQPQSQALCDAPLTARRHPRTLAEAFPNSVEAASWLECHRASWRWTAPLCTALAWLAVLTLALALAASCLGRL